MEHVKKEIFMKQLISLVNKPEKLVEAFIKVPRSTYIVKQDLIG